MAANNQVVLIGRAGNNVAEDARHLQSGTMVAEVRLAVNRPTKDAMGNPITDWITCQFWDKNAERLSEFVRKGDLLSISGSMRVDSWEKEGVRQSKVYVHGENFQMLESKKAREERQAGEGSAPPAQRQAQTRQPAAAGARRAAPQDDFSDDFDLDDDELPPF